MSDNLAVKVENVSKKYLISHEGPGYYKNFRDLLTLNFKRIFGRANFPNMEEFWALKDVSFEIKKGERVGIIGRNGAGKSTILKILSRITEPTEGRVTLHGRVASLLEVGTGFHPELTGRENIYLNGSILGMHRHEIKRKFDEIVAFAEVEKFLDTPVKRYSSGMYVRLAFAVAAHLEPEILIVDEVLAVGDAAFQKKCLGKMEEVSTGEGRTVLFVSHNMGAIRQLCQNCLLLNSGKLEKSGSTRDIVEFYEHQVFKQNESNGIAKRENVNKKFFISNIELRNKKGKVTNLYEAGDDLEIHVWTTGEPPSSNFTIEFNLFNELGSKISFGSANPIRETYFKKGENHFVCLLKKIPLLTGQYYLDFSTRVWGQERWDYWERAISFEITNADFFKTGYNLEGRINGDFILEQEWYSLKNE